MSLIIYIHLYGFAMGDSWISLKWTNGIDGEDGQDGSNGKNGKDGVSCNIIYQDSDSLKIFCGTDTTSFFIGGTETKSSNGTQKILIDKAVCSCNALVRPSN